MEIPLPKTNLLYKTVKTIASSRPGSWFFSQTLHHLDRTVVRLTRNRTSLTTLLTGLPVLTVTTEGAKTRKPRAVPLIGLPTDQGVIIIASNWGRAFHPAWYRNIKAHPTVTLSYHGQTAEYTARETEGELRATCWAQATEAYPGYDAYKRRAGTRQIPVILLTPKSVR
jgi:deazaflavin-dependent oxidoreductase (nitroreductase family)